MAAVGDRGVAATPRSESFPRAYWVAVPETLRARRANSRRRLADTDPLGFATVVQPSNIVTWWVRARYIVMIGTSISD
eukprot:SAG25_NODE_295_length_10249_cov_5.144926_20_plen_78_part_00